MYGYATTFCQKRSNWWEWKILHFSINTYCSCRYFKSRAIIMKVSTDEIRYTKKKLQAYHHWIWNCRRIHQSARAIWIFSPQINKFSFSNSCYVIYSTEYFRYLYQKNIKNNGNISYLRWKHQVINRTYAFFPQIYDGHLKNLFNWYHRILNKNFPQKTHDCRGVIHVVYKLHVSRNFKMINQAKEAGSPILAEVCIIDWKLPSYI